MAKKNKPNQTILVSFFLRIGLGLAFLYAAISAFLNPSLWINFIPVWVSYVLPLNFFLLFFVVYQVLLSLWLFSGQKQFLAAVFSVVTFFLIIVFNVTSLDIIFRDITLLCAALALVVVSPST